MVGNKYFYVGMGIISIFLIIGIVGMAYSTPVSSNKDAKITIELFGESESKEFAFFTSQEKLFSENEIALSFSPLKKGVHFSSDDFKCEISCKKEE